MRFVSWEPQQPHYKRYLLIRSINCAGICPVFLIGWFIMMCHALRSADSASLTADLSSSLQELGNPLCLSRYLYFLGNQPVPNIQIIRIGHCFVCPSSYCVWMNNTSIVNELADIIFKPRKWRRQLYRLACCKDSSLILLVSISLCRQLETLKIWEEDQSLKLQSTAPISSLT